jgi:hypothetical protein
MRDGNDIYFSVAQGIVLNRYGNYQELQDVFFAGDGGPVADNPDYLDICPMLSFYTGQDKYPY